MRNSWVIALCISMLTLASASAQKPAAPAASQATVQGSGKLPEGWKARLDLADAQLKDVSVIEEKNALTFATGPAGIYYKPGMKASGNYELSAAFSQLKTSQHAEGYGLFIGGSDLDKDGQRYTYFLIRQDGKFLIKSRAGAATRAIVDWTDAPSMREPKGIKTSSTLAIRAEPDGIRFFVGDKQVHRLSRSEAAADGIAGVRINHNLNVQVSRLALKKQP